MLRPVSLLPALAAVASLAAGLTGAVELAGAPTAAAEAAVRPAADPLRVTIDTMPSVLPRRGPVRVTGSVTNRDDDTWRDVRVYAFMSREPITTSDGLAEAVATPADAQVGDRIIDVARPGTEDTIDQLEAGTSAQFALTIPRRDLTITSAGVYWFGIHALGDGPTGRLDGADGRARTFLPYVPPTRRSVDTALVVPVRRLVSHTPDGAIGRLDRWATDLAPGGSLRSLVDLGVSAGARPVTWLVDPAVVDAVRRIAAGNPGRDLGATGNGGEQPDEGTGASESSSPSTDPSATGSPGATGSTGGPDGPGASGGTAGGDLTEAEKAAAADAATWLDRLHEGVTGSEVLSLPYGDVDVAAAAQHDPRVFRAARARAGSRLAPWGLPTQAAVAPPSGYLDPAGIRLARRRTTVLLSDRAFGPDAPAVAKTAHRRVVVASSGATGGGPGPDWRMSPLALRQRIVSEAALRLLTEDGRPLVAVLPATWRPGAAPGFFEGLDLSWLHLTDVGTVRSRPGRPVAVPADRLDYPDSQAGLQLDADRFVAADDLVRSGATLQNLLSQNDTVAGEIRDEAYTDLSYASRVHARATRLSAELSRAWVDDRLHAVRIDAPRAVILSSGNGRFAASVTNPLDEPVSVRIRAVADPPLDVSVPKQPVELGPRSRTTVLLDAASSAVGIRDVTLVLTDRDGVPLGSSDDLPIRSNRVSNVIWLIIGTGLALLFLAIVVRLVRRIRTARRGVPGPARPGTEGGA